MIPIPQFTPKRGLSSFVKSLFANSEQGAWYDPSDMATLFQTASGSDAVTAVEQPVSLMLDKSKGLALGTERITNGSFATDTTWTKGTGWSIGSDVATKTAGSAAALSQSVTVTAGTWYKVTFTATRTAGSVTPQFTGTTTVAGAAVSASGTYTRYLLAATGNNAFEFSGDASFAGTIDDVSIVSIAGNHAYTPSTATASRPVLSARVNLLTKTEQFDDAYWSKENTTVTTNQTTDPLGTSTADQLIETTANAGHIFYKDITLVDGANYKWSIYAKKSTRRYVYIRAGTRGGDSQATNWAASLFDFDTAAFVKTSSAGTGSTATFSFTNVGAGWYLLSVSYTFTTGTLIIGGTSNVSSAGFGLSNTDNPTFGNFGVYSYTGSTSESAYIWGADLRVANDGVGIPSYQRVNTSTDYDTVGFPMYLKFDGSDDYMLTNSVDFSGGDAICVGAAVRKLSDAALGVVLEHSATLASNNGTFLLSAPNSAAANFNFSSKGSTAVANTVTTYTSPISAVIVADADISADINNIRINNGTATAVTSDQGSGNYGNFAMYLGRRGGTASPFNGRLYGAIIRAGAANDGLASQIASYLNIKSKIY